MSLIASTRTPPTARPTSPRASPTTTRTRSPQRQRGFSGVPVQAAWPNSFSCGGSSRNSNYLGDLQRPWHGPFAIVVTPCGPQPERQHLAPPLFGLNPTSTRCTAAPDTPGGFRPRQYDAEQVRELLPSSRTPERQPHKVKRSPLGPCSAAPGANSDGGFDVGTDNPLLSANRA